MECRWNVKENNSPSFLILLFISITPPSLAPKFSCSPPQSLDHSEENRDYVAQGDANEVGYREEEDIFVEEEMVLPVGQSVRVSTLHVMIFRK